MCAIFVQHFLYDDLSSDRLPELLITFDSCKRITSVAIEKIVVLGDTVEYRNIELSASSSNPYKIILRSADLCDVPPAQSVQRQTATLFVSIVDNCPTIHLYELDTTIIVARYN